MKNIMINGNMSIAQRGASISAGNNEYTLDRWKFLGQDSTGGTVAQNAGGPSGSAYYMSVKNGTANKQTAIVQIVERKNSIAVIGGVATLSFQAKSGPGSVPVRNLRAALLGWTGTADGTGSATIISNWYSSGINPNWGASFNMLNVPSNLPLSNNWQTYKVEDIPIPSNVNNVAVVIWTDDAPSSANAEWDLAQVQLESGNVAGSFEFRSDGMELSLSQRYYQVFGPNGIMGFVESATVFRFGISSFSTAMRIAPTTTFSSSWTIQTGQDSGGAPGFSTSTAATDGIPTSISNLYGNIKNFATMNTVGRPALSVDGYIYALAEL